MTSRPIDFKLFIGLLAVVCFSCAKLKPEQVELPQYIDLQEVYRLQYKTLGPVQLEKSVSLDGETETQTISMDSLKWKDELSFFIEMNPNQPEYVGVFDEENIGEETILKLKPGEKGILKKLLTKYSETGFDHIQASIHEDKDVYVHHREIDVIFKNGLVSSYLINGYQKVILKDTIWFEIKGRVLN